MRQCSHRCCWVLFSLSLPSSSVLNPNVYLRQRRLHTAAASSADIMLGCLFCLWLLLLLPHGFFSLSPSLKASSRSLLLLLSKRKTFKPAAKISPQCTRGISSGSRISRQSQQGKAAAAAPQSPKSPFKDPNPEMGCCCCCQKSRRSAAAVYMYTTLFGGCTFAPRCCCGQWFWRQWCVRISTLLWRGGGGEWFCASRKTFSISRRLVVTWKFKATVWRLLLLLRWTTCSPCQRRDRGHHSKRPPMYGADRRILWPFNDHCCKSP